MKVKTMALLFQKATLPYNRLRDSVGLSIILFTDYTWNLHSSLLSNVHYLVGFHF